MFPFGDPFQDGENAWQLASVDRVSRTLRNMEQYEVSENKKIFAAAHHVAPSASLHPFFMIVPTGRKVTVLRVVVGTIINAANRNDFGLAIMRATSPGSTAGLTRLTPAPLDTDDSISEVELYVDETTVSGAVNLLRQRCTYLFTTAGIASSPVSMAVQPPMGAKPWTFHGGEVFMAQFFSAFPTGWDASLIWTEERE